MISDSPTRRNFGRRPALPRIFSIKSLAAVVAFALLLWCGWLWFRGSSFASVKHVTVSGLSGPQVGQISRALVTSAETMSTLDFNVSKLDESVQQFPYVRSLSVSTHFPHGVTIDVFEQVPIATISEKGRSFAVDGAGVLLDPTVSPHGALPLIPLRTGPAGNRVTAAGARAVLTVLAAAPYDLLAHIDNATSSASHGVILQMHNGPQLFFGPPTQLGDKWLAATAVLGESSAAGAQYIDVTDPQRPAAGAASSQTASTQIQQTASTQTQQPSSTQTQQPSSTDSQPQVQG